MEQEVPGGGAQRGGEQPVTFGPTSRSWMLMDSDVLQSPAQNPILKNITDYLIEEVSAEEEELLGSGSGMDPEENAKEGHPVETTVEREEKLAKVWRVHRRGPGVPQNESAQLKMKTLLPGSGPSHLVSAHRAFHRLLQRLRVPQRGRDAQSLRDDPRAWTYSSEPHRKQ